MRQYADQNAAIARELESIGQSELASQKKKLSDLELIMCSMAHALLYKSTAEKRNLDSMVLSTTFEFWVFN